MKTYTITEEDIEAFKSQAATSMADIKSAGAEITAEQGAVEIGRLVNMLIFMKLKEVSA